MVTRYASLKDAVVVVTGGGNGIGEAMARNFAEQGAKVAIIDVSQASAENLAEQFKGANHAPMYVQLDLTKADEIAPAFADIARKLGPVTVLVNNAANNQRHDIDSVTPAFWRDRMAVNLDHQFFCAQAVIPGMRAAGKGAIINMGSSSWHIGMGGMPGYVTAKAAIEGLTRGLARDLGPAGIRVNCVIPGFIRTARQVEKLLTPDFERKVLGNQCLQKLIEPEDVANLVAFLASDDAAMCTNQNYAIDGGWM
jgi:NAD(P)-dependent dehydrogenase (short-subunit alcohol dehydrogenase family)